MLFRPRRRQPTRREQWRAFARRLELLEVSGQEARLRDWLDLGENTLEPLYRLRRQGQPSLYLFDQTRQRTGPTGSVTSLVSGVLLRAPAALAAASLRAQVRRNPVLESIEAGRTGSRRLAFPERPDFEAQVSIFARDEAAARVWLSERVQQALQRMLLRRGVRPMLVVGNRHMLALCEAAEAVPFAALEALASDLFTLYAMVEGAGGEGGTRGDGTAGAAA